MTDKPISPLRQRMIDDTEATVTLPKGRHTLQLLLGDAYHVPHQPPVYSDPVIVYAGMSPPHVSPPAVSPPAVRRHRRRRYHAV